MRKEQWESLQAIIRGEEGPLRAGLIVDSPWMPGYCGVSNVDFYARPEVWLDAYRKIRADFPGVLFLPDWWNEFGMATEPSGFGCRFDFYDDNLPTVHHIIPTLEDADLIERLQVPDPRKSGLMPLLLNLQRYVQPRLQELGEEHYIVSTRGPLTIASHLMPLTELLLGVKMEGETIHKLLRCTTALCIRWLEAQLENVGTARGILVLDDVTGFLSEEDYLEFAHPYLKEIFRSFPGLLHLFHNDTDSDVSVPWLDELGVDLYNFTHKKNIGDVRRKIGDRVCLLGNVPPMSLVKESPETVYAQTRQVIADYCAANGSHRGLLVSLGGGVPMGARQDTIDAFLRAVADYA